MKPLELHDDDQPVGRLLSRREALAMLGGITGAAMLGAPMLGKFLDKLPALGATPPATPGATALPSCVVRPALTEGPYFVDEMLNRSDIRIDPSDGSIKEGLPLRLVFRVSDVSSTMCSPLKGAQVDVWHCDALGVYSDVQDAGFDTSGQQWLRGYQVTDDTGTAEFITIYPGWYQGRAVHIHFKIRTDPESDAGYEFTSQLFFDDELSEAVYENEPYASKGKSDMLNEDDGIFQQSEGLLTLTVEEEEIDDVMGYVAIFDIGLDTSQPSPSESGNGGGGPGGQGGPGGPPPGGRGTPPPR